MRLVVSKGYGNLSNKLIIFNTFAFFVWFICKVEEELMDWLKKTSALKQKKKPLGRKEKESIWKAIEIRDSLIKKLDKQS